MPERTITTHNKLASQVFSSVLALLLSLTLTLTLTSAWAQEEIADQLTAELIYPQEIAAGETFSLHALIHNHSNKVLHTRIFSQQRQHEDYGYRRPLSSTQVATLQPGESRYLTIGSYYFTGTTLSNQTIVLNDLNLMFSEPEQSLTTAPHKSLSTVTIRVQDDDLAGQPNPALYPVPSRQALMITDLADEGDQLLIHDPNTGYDWIKVSETIHLSPDDVQYALSTNPLLQDFKLARTSQISESLLNHIHAQGIAAQINDLSSTPPHHLVAPMADFVRLHGTTRTLGNAYVVSGLVADEARSLQNNMATLAMVEISGNDAPPCDSFVCPMLGLRSSAVMTDSEENPDFQFGYWLVRGAPEVTRPANKTSLLDDQLVIPALKIDGQYYRAALQLIDRKPGLFRQLSLQTVAPDLQAAEFNSSSGLLELPGVVLIESDGSESRADLTLRLIPDTMPAVLELVGMTMI